MSIWRRRKRKDGNGDVDVWARDRLSAEVPEGSFERVWARVERRLEPKPVATMAPWELALTVRRLRLWRRVLAGGLVAVTAFLVAVLLSDREREQGETPVQIIVEERVPGQWGKLLSARWEGEGSHESYARLDDSRIIYRGVQPEGDL